MSITYSMILALICGAILALVAIKGRMPIRALAALGGVLIVVAGVLAITFGYSRTAIVDMLLLQLDSDSDPWWLVQHAVAGYSCIIGSLIAVIWSWVRTDRDQDPSPIE